MSANCDSLSLTGRIEFRLSLTGASSYWSGSRKRRRDENENRPSSAPGLPPDSKLGDESRSAWGRAGLVFLPSSSCVGVPMKVYILIVPFCLLKFVCDAARYEHTVQISKFHERQIDGGSGPVALLCLGSGGLTVLDSESSKIQNWSESGPALSLSLIHQIERARAIDSGIEQPHGSVPKGVFTFRATVDAISPIITALPSDPFAIIELYESNGDMLPKSCVVVLKGDEALTCHAGIQPGDEIIFRQVRRQQWHVPMSFVKKSLNCMGRRVPTHVFVVSDSRSIEWSTNPTNIPPLPSTVDHLCSVEGIIQSVQFRCFGPYDTSVIHAVELDLSQEKESSCPCILYTTHFPMSPNLEVSLATGALVRAVNVHALPVSDCQYVSSYGACLRSTITLISSSGGCEDIPDKLLAPFAFSKVRQSYVQYALQSCFERRLEATVVDEAVRKVWSRLSWAAHAGSPVELMSILTGKPKRDPYLEFFDHACDNDDFAPKHAAGCHMSDCGIETQRVTVFTLDEIRHASRLAMRRELAGLLDGPTGDSISQTGSTASMRLHPRDLQSSVKEDMSGLSNTMGTRRMFAVGEAQSIDHDNRPSALVDDLCCLPISVTTEREKCEADPIVRNDIVVVEIETSIVSCLCLGKSNGSQRGYKCDEDRLGSIVRTFESPPWDLPSLISTRNGRNRRGACWLLQCHGHLYVVSVHLVCSFAEAVQNANPRDVVRIHNIIHDGSTQPPRAKLHTIHTCLGQETSLAENECFVGLLTRQRYRFKKSRNDTYAGCALTLNHFSPPTSGPLERFGPVDSATLSPLQSIELKLLVDLAERAVNDMRSSIRKVLGDAGSYNVVFDEQVHLATAWWTLADSSVTSLLVTTGLDDVFHGDGSNHSYYVPVLSVPMSAIEHGNFGYVRFRCNAEEVTSSFVIVVDAAGSKPNAMGAHEGPTNRFVSIGGRKVLPGALDRHPPRRLFSDYKDKPYIGELVSIPPFVRSGIPVSTLADLHWRICSDVKKHSQSALAPSMAQCIRRARLFSILFCRARVECSRCFEPLVLRPTSGKDRKATCMYEDDGPSFWHLPLPIPGQPSTRGLLSAHGAPTSIPPQAPPPLVCPNDCPDDCAEVKWECSGIVDDGTGQAKLYAEREAALLLLGPSLNVRDIEQGAWLAASGISFQKSVPPKSSLRYAILEAQACISQGASRWSNVGHVAGRRHVKPDWIWSRLSVEARADYAMQEHCRYSSEPRRCVDVIV